MYIKTLTIQGFKSYRDQIQIEPFSPKHDVVVGRNGSGKSNFFAAIRFVLSDAYQSISSEERVALLHEGASVTTTLSAYVEIVFDNSDNRFPTGNSEVILRRTIGAKKDDYLLDKKSANKADVMNLLESAGFSKSNPYYIVPQGRITALTNAKDHERLTLLKEVAGTKIYEQRRAESLRIMDETDAKRATISERLEFIENQLNELEEEKEELKEFQEKDKERRCLEYALHSRELEEVTETLNEIEEERKNELHNSNTRRQKFNQREKEIQTLEKSIREKKHEMDALASTREDAQVELTDLVRSRTELECTVSDLQSAQDRTGGQKEDLERSLEQIKAEIARKEKALSKLIPEWEQKRNAEASEKRHLEDANAKLSGLFAKRGRNTKFRTKAERDAYLKNEVKSLRAFVTSQTDALDGMKTELETSRRSRAEVELQIADLHTRVEDGKAKVSEFNAEHIQLKDRQSNLVEQRKEKWREDTRLEGVVARASEELRTVERSLAGMMDKDTGAGLRAIDRIAERHNLTGVYGPLYRLFTVSDPKFNTAVELTAGNSLFHVVVDTDETASKVLDIMMKEKSGRVTFMPLNRLKPKNPTMPPSEEAIPLLDQLEYDEAHTKAFQQVFGKTWVCHNLTVAAQYVRKHGINTITLDGDKVDRKGALTGGYHDVRRSRIDTIKNVQIWRERQSEESKKSKATRSRIIELDQELAQVSGRLTVLGTKQNQIRDERDRIQAEGAALTREKQRLEERISKIEQSIDELEQELKSSDEKAKSYQAELGTPLVEGLTSEEESMLDSLAKEVEQRTKEVAELSKQRNAVEGKKATAEIELNEKLIKRRDELQTRVEALDDTGADDSASTEMLDTRTRELRSLNTSIENVNKRMQEMEGESDELTNEIQADQRALERVQSQQAEDSRNISKQQKTTERYLAKRQMLNNRKDECNRTIRDLGVLPEEAFEKYTGEKLDKLVKKLHSVNEGLKKFAHVNKKAFEMYNNFTKQRDTLLERREDLDRAAESIQELVDVLDQRKDEAIERTFKQVAANFEEVFEKLVPAGRGRLIIQRRIDQDEEEEEDDTQKSSVDNYTGVSIKVSFNSKVDEGLRIQQLSGGQKSLVALATVFAIQKCDPAPFYLFDEIDANLDAQYRTAVASMIQSLSGTAQFIVTTFRPEMLMTADKFYGVLFNNQKISSVRSIRREEAMEFVDQEAQAQ